MSNEIAAKANAETELHDHRPNVELGVAELRHAETSEPLSADRVPRTSVRYGENLRHIRPPITGGGPISDSLACFSRALAFYAIHGISVKTR
jgi:hypothetical protein